MATEFTTLTEIHFKHRFFPNNQLECFTVRPDAATAQLFLRYGILFKSFCDGFKLLYCSFQNEVVLNREHILDGAVIKFHIYSSDPYFFNYTESGIENCNASLYYFSNFNREEESEHLHIKEFVSNADVVGENTYPEKFFSKPFGIIELELRNNLMQEYKIHFKEKESHWRYIFVSDHFKDFSQLSIIGENMEFEGPITITLPDKRLGISFVSKTPIRHRQKPDKYFKLVTQHQSDSSISQVLIASLPIPDIQHISSVVKQTSEKKYYSEIFIY